MEYALREQFAEFAADKIKSVLILVLMEYALREVNHKSYFQTTHKASEPHSHFKKVII